MHFKTGIRLTILLSLMFAGNPRAFAMHSYSDVVTTLRSLANRPHTPSGAHVQVTTIGSTVKGRAILMAVLSADTVETPSNPGPDIDIPPLSAEDEEDQTGGDPEAEGDESTGPAETPVDGTMVLNLEPVGDAGAGMPPVLPLPSADASDLPLTAEAFGPADGQTRRVLIICRQHGNEPAGTEAGMQFLKEFATTEDPARLAILRRVTFLIIPMLNADGAEAYQRRNARNVDLNRNWISHNQPETAAVVRVARAWRPDLIVDAHELHPTDWTPSFVEAMQAQAGAPAAVANANRAATAAVVGPLRAQSMRINARPVDNYRSPRLAHRFFSVYMGIPTILVESRRAGGAALEWRTALHYAAFHAVARHMSGLELGMPPRVVASRPEGSASRSSGTSAARQSAQAQAARRRMQLASRGGYSRRSSVKKKPSSSRSSVRRSSTRHSRRRR